MTTVKTEPTTVEAEFTIWDHWLHFNNRQRRLNDHRLKTARFFEGLAPENQAIRYTSHGVEPPYRLIFDDSTVAGHHSLLSFDTTELQKTRSLEALRARVCVVCRKSKPRQSFKRMRVEANQICECMIVCGECMDQTVGNKFYYVQRCPNNKCHAIRMCCW